MTRGVWIVAALAALLALPLRAQEAQPASTALGDVRVEDTVVVMGEQPGPGMWIVRKGDHDLYLLGTLSPLPNRMQWRATQVQRVLAQAQEVIRLRGVYLDFKAGFGGIFLLPKLFAARKNPDGKKLMDLVSPESYARWLTLKARYIGSRSGVERWRPLYAAMELYDEAMKKNGLSRDDVVWPVVAKAVEAHHPTVTVVSEAVVIADPKNVLAEWSKSDLDDLTCFDNTMRHIESDIGAMGARANAWATGDVAALRALPPAYRFEECNAALSEAGVGKRLGFGNALHNVDVKWLAAAEAALGRNSVTFAAVPLGRLLGANGYLARLQAKGYTVIAPDAGDAEVED